MNKWIKTAAALAILASFGAANAQSGPKVDETVKQTQKPSSGTQPEMSAMTKASGPKVDDAVKQTQKPSSGREPTTGMASGAKVDDTVKQTQRPGDIPEVANTGRKTGTMNKSDEKKMKKDKMKKDKMNHDGTMKSEMAPK